MTPIELYQALVSHFDEQELQTLCFGMGVDYQSLPAIGKANKARELLLLIARQERVDVLLSLLAQMRPQMTWPKTEAEVAALTRAIQPELVAPTPSTADNSAVSIGGSVQGPVSGGDMEINAPVVGGDLTINEESGWQRWGLLLLIVLGVITVGGLAMLLRPLFAPSATPPDIDNFLPVTQSLSPSLDITAMTVAQMDEEETLWFGAWVDERSKLYRLDVSQKEKATVTAVLEVESEITEIMVDCRQNVWLILDEIGVRVYRPTTDQSTTILNKATTDDWMSFNTMNALAHRCLDTGEVEVWLGRMGVNTLRYQSDYPEPESINYTPHEEDPVFLVSKELEITDLIFDLEKATLFISSSQGDLLSISTRNVRQPESINYNETIWSLSLSPSGEVWVGGTNHLIDNQDLLTVVDENDNTPDSRARLIAVGERWVWFGDSCPEISENCWTLGAYENGRFFPINLKPRKEVTALVVDSNQVVWIGTENGIILYP